MFDKTVAMKALLFAVVGLVAAVVFPSCGPLEGGGGGDPLDISGPASSGGGGNPNRRVSDMGF